MKNTYKPNWFDFFMLFWAVLPFVILIYGLPAARHFNFPFIVVGIMYVFSTFFCLGFPAATILYFIWRFNGSKTQSAT